MSERTRFRVNRPRVVHETLDGEVVIIDLRTGSYYSLTSSGAAVWEALDRGFSMGEVAKSLSGRYGMAPNDVEPSVLGLVEELKAEGLIVGVDGDDGEREASAPDPDDATSVDQPFEPPRLQKFEDMQDLILLDPVHEIDEEAGWPHARSDTD